jgi:hypothetical protein
VTAADRIAARLDRGPSFASVRDAMLTGPPLVPPSVAALT